MTRISISTCALDLLSRVNRCHIHKVSAHGILRHQESNPPIRYTFYGKCPITGTPPNLIRGHTSQLSNSCIGIPLDVASFQSAYYIYKLLKYLPPQVQARTDQTWKYKRQNEALRFPFSPIFFRRSCCALHRVAREGLPRRRQGSRHPSGSRR